MSKEWDPENVFDVLGCEYAQEILLAAAREPRSAQQLADQLEASPPTVYRRLDALGEYGFIEEELEYDAAGNHFKRYETSVEELTVTLDEAGIAVTDTTSVDLPEKFQSFWKDLEGGDPTAQLERLVDLLGRSDSDGRPRPNSDG